MSIAWKPTQAQQQVAAILARHPPESNECERAAAAILPIARRTDPASRAVKIRPAGRARFLMTKVLLGGCWWRHHVTTEVTAHYVDSLTGAPGAPVGDYFEQHYQYPEIEAYSLTEIEL